MSLPDNPDVLIALGALQHILGPDFETGSSNEIGTDQLQHKVERGTVHLTFSSKLPIVSDDISSHLAQTWRDSVTSFSNRDRRRGLRIHIHEFDSEDPKKLIQRIQSATGVDSISITDLTTDSNTSWAWPIQVAALGSSVNEALDFYPHKQLVQRPNSDQIEFDLLIVEHPAELDNIHMANLSASFLLMLVDSAKEVQALLENSLVIPARYHAIGVVVRPDNLSDFLHTFLDELAHDQPLDIAVAHAVENRDDYAIRGNPWFLDQARASLSNAELEHEIEVAFQAKEINEEAFREAMDSIRALPPADPVLWEHEGMAASDSIVATERAREILTNRPRTKGPLDAAKNRTNRHLQGQVNAMIEGTWTRRLHSFEPDGKHQIRVRIGQSDLNWSQIKEPFPDLDLPKDETRLTVTLLSPTLLNPPLQREIYLRETGSSTVAEFELTVPLAMEIVEATVIVQHEGRHLQTMVLTGPVAPGDESTGEIRFERGAPSQTDLSHQRAAQLSIWKNKAELVFTMFDPDAQEDEPSNRQFEPSLAGIDKVVDSVRDLLFRTAQNFDWLDGTLETDGLEMIRSLAEQGWYLRDRLFNDPPNQIHRIQFASPYSSDSFPVEFLYDYDLPDKDAILCRNYKNTSGSGCEACEARTNGKRFVCPSGFWGLNRVIERQVRPTVAHCVQPESSDRVPGPFDLTGLVFAAADEVNEGDSTRIARTIEALQEIAPVHKASHWESWKNSVKEQYPGLLIALPHNVEDTPWQKLRIAADQDLDFVRIEREHVAPEGAPIGSPILLFACNSANAVIEYQDFVMQLRCVGAPFVIATVTYILGPQAAPMALEFTRQFWDSRGTSTLGETLISVRNSMLKKDNPMALALVAYGDADWRI
ncbi:MAG: hypothetical protein N0E44_22165 [Candidatus Thiodiazotropha lotti]|nr:hypothetical protein [Candidatus Thiodiazotropha lotti]MCW4222579.1 hypothetical protein [Candidatus Thiodiazotropha lotti]